MMKFTRPAFRFILGGLCILACSKSTEPESNSCLTPIYITVAGHIEDTPGYANCASYPDYRARLLEFAEKIASYDIAFNLQVDYEFFAGAFRCETPQMQAETNGMNVIDYLVTAYGFEIDAHQEGGREEGQDNYADVHFLGGKLTSGISDVVGGLLWDDPDQFACLAGGERGRLFPDYTWQPKIFSLAVSYDHHLGDFSRDDVASGVWRSKGTNADFWVHDREQPVITIGPGEHTDWGRRDVRLSSPEFVQWLADGLASGTIPSGKIYTVTLTVPQSIIFSKEEHPRLIEKFHAFAPAIASGQAEYATYSEVAQIWRLKYQEQANIYFREAAMRPWEK